MNFKGFSNRKKTLTILGGIVLLFLVVAVVIGVLNALVADGTWSIGWSSYRYDETDYEIGSGTVLSKDISTLDIDWIDGNVDFVLCDDAYISITETYEGDYSDSDLLRKKISADGKSLFIKYRKSAAFLGLGGGGSNKTLIVRIPKYMLDDLSLISVNGKLVDVSLNGVSAEKLQITTERGNISILEADFTTVNLTAERGNIWVQFHQEYGFTLQLDCDKNRFICDQPLDDVNGAYRYGDGKAQISVIAPKGNVEFTSKKD